MFNSIIEKITLTDGLTLITVANLPNSAAAISSVLGAIAGAKINIDMICQTPPYNDKLSLSFTVSDNDFAKALKIIGGFKGEYEDLRTDVNSGNSKIVAYGEQIIETRGVAASLFKAIADASISIKLITTSDVDISVLLSREEALLALHVLS